MFASRRDRSFLSDVREWMRDWPSRRSRAIDLDRLTDQVAQRLSRSMHGARGAWLRTGRTGREWAQASGESAVAVARSPYLRVAAFAAGLSLLAVLVARR